MKAKTIILIVLAIGCGLAASYMTSKLAADRSAPPPDDTPKVKVLVAIKKVPAFELIKQPEKYFIEKEVPEGTYPAKCLKSFEEVRNQRLGKVKNEEETVFKEDIQTNATAGIMQNLPDGQRAMTIRVSPETSVAGFALPGSRVDLIGTITGPKGDLTAETMMQNMLVLAVDTTYDRTDKTTVVGSTVTFAVTPQEANRLAVATQATNLRLVLRKPEDKDKLTLPVAHLGDWNKPDDGNRLADGGSASDGDGNPTLPGARPSISKKPAPGTKPDDVSAPPLVEKSPEIHKMTILSGDYEQTYVYVKNEKGDWMRTQYSDEKPVAHLKPAPTPPTPLTPLTPPAAKPADSDKSFKSESSIQGPAIPATPPVGDRVQ